MHIGECAAEGSDASDRLADCCVCLRYLRYLNASMMVTTTLVVSYARLRSVLIPSRVVLWTDDETSTFGRPSIDDFNDIDEFLFIFNSPIDLVVISRSQIHHDVLVSVEEHD